MKMRLRPGTALVAALRDGLSGVRAGPDAAAADQAARAPAPRRALRRSRSTQRGTDPALVRGLHRAAGAGRPRLSEAQYGRFVTRLKLLQEATTPSPAGPQSDPRRACGSMTNPQTSRAGDDAADRRPPQGAARRRRSRRSRAEEELRRRRRNARCPPAGTLPGLRGTNGAAEARTAHARAAERPRRGPWPRPRQQFTRTMDLPRLRGHHAGSHDPLPHVSRPRAPRGHHPAFGAGAPRSQADATRFAGKLGADREERRDASQGKCGPFDDRSAIPRSMPT